ncbi:MAG: hypothetical protein SFT90_01500 [Rickettsiales bacterium]|nr:hypothetical protein [Rickettsiales bacterium]
MNLTTIRYVILTALRDFLFVGILGALIASVFLSHFLASTVMLEKQQMLSSFTTGSARVVLVVGMIVFICFHIRRAFENREIDLMLSRPISRASFIFSYWLGFSIVALLMVSALAFYMICFFEYDYTGLSIWVSSMVLELFIIVAFALFTSVILKSSVSSVLLCFGFYILSRMIGFFHYVLEKAVTYTYEYFEFYAQKIIWLVSFLMPRLDLFAQSKWLVYGVDFSADNLIFPVIQTLIYVPLLLCLAIVDFSRKQF